MLNHVVNRFIDRQRWLEPVADFIQKIVAGSYKILGNPGHALKTFMNGTWLGHPLHPVLTDIPLGAWTVALTLDALEGLSRRKECGAAADLAIGVGLVGAVGSAITGITDWSETDDPARKVGLLHGLLNVAATTLYATSL